MNGSEKRRQTMIDKYGSEEAWLTAQQEWGAKGGARTSEQGLSGFKHMTPQQRSEAGKKGHAAMIEKMRHEA